MSLVNFKVIEFHKVHKSSSTEKSTTISRPTCIIAYRIFVFISNGEIDIKYFSDRKSIAISVEDFMIFHITSCLLLEL